MMRAILHTGAATGKTRSVSRRHYIYACDLGATQRALFDQLLAERFRPAPVPVKPALRGRRHGW